MRVKTMFGLCCCAVLAMTMAASSRAALEVGVTEDAGKSADKGAAFYAAMTDLGLKANRVSISWDPANPTTIANQGEVTAWLPQAQASGTRVIFAVSPLKATGITASPTGVTEFVAFVKQLAQTFPSVRDYVIGNEPNQPRFWLPQYKAGTAKPLSAPAYMTVLAQSYDALKSVDPTINVIGLGLSPRGNDQPVAPSNSSRSPVRFLHDLGVAYRASHRA